MLFQKYLCLSTNQTYTSKLFIPDACLFPVIKMKVAQSCLTLCNPMDYRVHGIPQARILEQVAVPFARESSQPRSPSFQVDPSPAEPRGKPKNARVGSLSLLKRVFPTQKLNRGLLHCRQILFQFSCQGSPLSDPG